jgi:hypothetical protein
LTLYLPGECGSVMAFTRRFSGRSFSHRIKSVEHSSFGTRTWCYERWGRPFGEFELQPH